MTTFRLANEADDAVLRSILRENAMPTWVEMAVEREPSFFARKNTFGRDWAVIAEEGDEVVGMYTAAIMPVHLNGRVEQLGYLGGLRVQPRYRHRIRYLREGYASILPLAAAAGTRPWWFTVLAAENNAARRLLEAGVAGLPHYRAHGDYVMLGLATARGARTNLWRRAQEADLQRALAFHSAHAERFQFSPVLDEATVRSIGLEHFLVHERAGAIAGVAALWNQQAFKQIVARRYRWPIGTLLPMYNGYARICRRVPLPAPGRSLEMTFIAFLALDDDALAGGTALIRDLLSRCDTPVAALGLHASHPLCASLDALRPMRYPSRVYSVSFESAPTVGPLPAQPEVALL
jgi:hypothetical protein